MSLKAKIEAVIYASEEPVTIPQLVGVLGVEAQAELDALDERQGTLLPLEGDAAEIAAGAAEEDADSEAMDPDALNAETLGPSAEPSETNSEAEDGRAADSPPSAAPAAAVLHGKRQAEAEKRESRDRERRLREYFRSVLDNLIADYAEGDRGLEVREVAGGFRFATKPEFHDTVRGFVRSLKPPLKLSLQALETLAVVAYRQPVTAPEVSEVRGVDSGGVLGSLLSRKLITTAGRKQVIGRPILYKTTKEFLLRFGLKDTSELPSIEEFEKMAGDLAEAVQEEIPMGQAPEETPAARTGESATDPLTGREGDAKRFVDFSRAEPMRNAHEAQADGIPSEEQATPPGEGPGEFEGNENADPRDNAAVDGRISGVPPTYDPAGDADTESPAHDAEVQSGQE